LAFLVEEVLGLESKKFIPRDFQNAPLAQPHLHDTFVPAFTISQNWTLLGLHFMPSVIYRTFDNFADPDRRLEMTPSTFGWIKAVWHAVLATPIFENGRPKLTIGRDSASPHHKGSRRTRQWFHPLSLADRRYRAPRPFAWHPLWASYENRYEGWSSDDLRILDGHANILGREVPNLVNGLFKLMSNARDNASPPERCGAQIDRAGVRGNKSVQDLQACGAGVRRGSEDGISIWRGAAFWASKGYSFLHRDHFTHTRSAHTPARDDHSGVFPFLVKRGKHSAAMDQRIRPCNASLMSFAVICKAASHSCPFNSLSLALLPCFGRLFV